MTRGTAYLIADKYIIETLGFNGDMYREGNGEEMVRFLNECNSLNSFKKAIRTFNEENHKYDNVELFYNNVVSEFMNSDKVIEMTSENYYKLFFSDWTFWKNISSNDVKFLTRDGEEIILKQNEVVAINFGYKEDCYFGSELKGELKEG